MQRAYNVCLRCLPGFSRRVCAVSSYDLPDAAGANNTEIWAFLGGFSLVFINIILLFHNAVKCRKYRGFFPLCMLIPPPPLYASCVLQKSDPHRSRKIKYMSFTGGAVRVVLARVCACVRLSGAVRPDRLPGSWRLSLSRLDAVSVSVIFRRPLPSFSFRLVVPVGLCMILSGSLAAMML